MCLACRFCFVFCLFLCICFSRAGSKQGDGMAVGLGPLVSLIDGVESARGKQKPVFFMVWTRFTPLVFTFVLCESIH
jgi:hypothetical protein